MAGLTRQQMLAALERANAMTPAEIAAETNRVLDEAPPDVQQADTKTQALYVRGQLLPWSVEQLTDAERDELAQRRSRLLVIVQDRVLKRLRARGEASRG